MSNFFGKTICIMFADTTVITHGYIELTLSNDNNIKLCNNFELCLISSVGYNLTLKTKTGDILFDSYNNNKYTSTERLIENELTNKNDVNIEKNLNFYKITIPLFSARYTDSIEYLQTLKTKSYVDGITGYKIELNINFCKLDDIVMTNNLSNDEIKLNYKLLMPVQ